MQDYMLHLVEKMHKKFNLTFSDVPFTDREKTFRITAMLEEVIEYTQANTDEEELDALCDLLVFVLGTVIRQGYESIFVEAFTLVMDANMNKELGPNKKRGNFQFDLIKPKNWKAPNFSKLIERL